MTTKTRTTDDIDGCVQLLTDRLEIFAIREIVHNLVGCIDAMRDVVTAKGYKHGYQDNVDIDGNNHTIKVRMHIVDDSYDQVRMLSFLHNYHADATSLSSRMNELAREVIALPTMAEHKRAVWQGKLKVLAEEGEALNMGFEYTQMLRATAEKLAKNALAAPVRMSVHDYERPTTPQTPPF